MNQMQWYAIQTKPKAEFQVLNNVASRLIEQGEEVYLPTEAKAKSKLPLFSRYVFVKHNDAGFHKIKYTPGVKDYVRFGQYPTPIPTSEIELVKKVEAHFNQVGLLDSYLVKGSKVKIVKGVLAGREGILTQDQQGKKVAIQLGSLGQSVLLQVPVSDVVTI